MDTSPLLIKYGIDPEAKLIYTKWKSPYNSEQYRACVLHIIKVIETNQIKLWLHEAFMLQNLSKEDQRWTVEVMALFLAQGSIKHIAIVRPEVEVAVKVGKYIKERVTRIFGKIVGVEFFETIEDAKAWLVPQRLYYKLPPLHDATAMI